MQFTELLEKRNRYKKKLSEIEEELHKGNPMYINGRKLSVFEMVQCTWRLRKLIDTIDTLDVNIEV